MDEQINILLVDDEQRNLDALEAILENPGHRLLRADDAQKALKLLLDNDVAAIVLDIKMPGVSGFELAHLIKGTKKFREIPIVFMTAYMIDDQDERMGYDAGAVDYLTKPVKPQILRHKIAVFAELFRKTRELALLNETLEARVQERTTELERSEAVPPGVGTAEGHLSRDARSRASQSSRAAPDRRRSAASDAGTTTHGDARAGVDESPARAHGTSHRRPARCLADQSRHA
jgi:CheY-like chemotaxis protein